MWDIYTCSAAASNGHLECFKYAHENGCPWDNDTCYEAAENRHLECLKYAHENGCSRDECSLFYESGDCTVTVIKPIPMMFDECPTRLGTVDIRYLEL